MAGGGGWGLGGWGSIFDGRVGEGKIKGGLLRKVQLTSHVRFFAGSQMADPQNKPTSISPDVLEAAQILVMMKHGIRAFLEAQQARYRIPYLYYASLNPTISAQLHYFLSHGIPFSPLYDISPMPAAYQFPVAHGMLASSHCIVGPPRTSTGGVSNNGESEGEMAQPGRFRFRLYDKELQLIGN